MTKKKIDVFEKKLDSLLRNLVIKSINVGEKITIKSSIKEIEETKNELEKMMSNIISEISKEKFMSTILRLITSI
jgi:signal-transduction protein with cAMP-binding, CBS, and nucleotidyltransferase domain